MTKPCHHTKQIQAVQPGTPAGCAECLAKGFHNWHSLRLCMICGHVGCCDDSKYKHATKHYKETNHPIMRGYKTKHHYRWCYTDEISV